MTEVGATAQRVARHVRSIAALELQLARLELRRKAAALGIGAVLLAGAALLAVLAIWFVFAGVATAFALVLPAWAGWLVTAGILFLLAGLAAVSGVAALRRATPPIPEQALEEARRTTDALKVDGRA